MEEEDQERKRKLEAGKAKLAQFRQRKGQTDGQTTAKKTKKKKSSSSSKQRDHPEEASEAGLSQSDGTHSQNAPSGAGTTTEFTIMRTLPHGEVIKHDKTYTIEPESEVSTTADDYSSEVVSDSFLLTPDSTAHIQWEEEFGVQETFSERGTQSSQARLEVMEDELAGKQQEIEELNRELEEMRAAYGTEGLQQLQEFETAIKQRDSIITQLTTNLQQARKEKDDIMREFLDLTEQSQKLKIQFQHLQAGESLRNTSHTSTATDLLHSKQQIFTYQQQLEDRSHQLRLCQQENDDFQTHILSLKDQMHSLQQVQQKELELSLEQKMNEKDLQVDSLKSALRNEEIKCLELKERIVVSEKSVDEFREQLTQKSQEINSLSEELNLSKQRERRSSDEIKQLMGAVEDLQKKHHKDSQSEADLAQRMELETQKKLEQLQAELDEMHGRQIVQMKQELARQHTLEIEGLLAQHKHEVDSISNQKAIHMTNEKIDELNAVIAELNARLLYSDEQRIKMKEDFSHRLENVSSEKSHLQRQIEDLLQDLSFAREQVHRAKQSLTEKENKLNEASSSFLTIDRLKEELAAASEFTKELESKHEAEVTNYKIKLDMLEREKDAVLDRMAESQEAELEKLRTNFLFSQEEELTKLKEDLTLEHKTNIENLKDNLEVRYKQQLEQMQHETSQTITDMQLEKDSLITKQNYLMLEMSKMKELMQSVSDPKTEDLMIQIHELQKELDCLRKEEKEKGTIEQEVQVLQLRIEFLENEVKDKDALMDRLAALEDDNRLLKDENDALQSIWEERNSENCEHLAELVNSDFQQEIELLTSENKRLQNLQLQLKEEIQRQKDTFSFAEKNFEVNYHELQEEYTCLVKVKEQLEGSKSKLEEEYKIQLDSLNNELVKLKGISAEEDPLGPSQLVKADKLDVGEIVEKDTTELMEKLENAQRDKQELSLKLSNLSEQLQSKQNEINRLKEQVKSLCCERDHVLLKNIKVPKENSTESRLKVSGAANETPVNNESLIENTRTGDFPPLQISPQLCSLSPYPELSVVERELQELTSKPESESSLLRSVHLEKEDLTQKLDIVRQEEDDKMLQLQAQRVSLTQIHKAHLELMSETFQAEKESELCSLRDSLLSAQDQNIQELQDVHQRELVQHTAFKGETCQILTEMLMKIINKELDHNNQVLLGRQTDKEDKTEGTEMLDDVTHMASLEHHRSAVQTLHTNLTILLERFFNEYKEMRNISSCMEKTGDLEGNKEEPDITGVRQIVIDSQTSALSQSDVQEVLIVPEPPSEEAEKLKSEFSQQRAQLEDRHSEEIEHLRSYFQQQLKENEDRFSTEIIHLQEQYQNVTVGSVEFRELCDHEPGVELGLQEAAIFQSVSASVPDLVKTDEVAPMGDHSVRMPGGPIYHQLQTLRQALFAKYVEEVRALKKQHEAELSQLRADLTQKQKSENAALKQEVAQLTSAKQDLLSGSFQIKEKSPVDLNLLLEERYHEKIEEEIARVIVQMTIAFAQQSELTRLSSLQSAESKGQRECHQSGIHDVEATDQDGQTLHHEIIVQSLVTSNDKDMTSESHGASLVTEPLSKDKTVVLKEEDYNQMVAMGAESAKFRDMYEERVEEMAQELVKQEQEYQQAAEALRLAHTAQLERQMYDQEQLLSELHGLRAQLAENASAISENQVTEREKILLDELESMKQTCAEVSGRTRVSAVQDNSSQTQDEPVSQPERTDQVWECGPEDGERKVEDGEIPSSDPSSERKSLKRANKHLLKILLEIVKTTGAVEETIGRHVLSLLDKAGRRQSASKVFVWSAKPEELAAVPAPGITVTDDENASAGGKETGTRPEAAEEDLDVPLQFTKGDAGGTDVSPEDEAQILSISTRLQAAVEKLLEAINETSNQLEHAKAAQTELVRESIKRKQETTDLVRCQEELQERLNEEASAREHLVLELSKAEGLLDGYTDERVFLEKQLQEKSDLIRHLEQELHSTGNRLQELVQEREQMEEERELLARQKHALKADAAPAEQQLLEETEKLFKEKIEVQRQAEKDSGDLHKQVKVLEVELEEQVNRYMELEQEKNADLEDLRQKNISLEKQLEKTRRFLDEQAVDREHERDVFQQEIQKLEQQLKMPQRHQPVNDHQSNELEKLENNLKEKTDKCSELVLCKEQLQRDVLERNEEIEKLECRIRELEQALIISADSLQKVEERRTSIVIGVKGEMPLEAQLQVEREAIDRKEKEVTNLVEQLEQFREELENKNEEVQQLHMQLEIQRKESATRLQELEQENNVLKEGIESPQHEHQTSPENVKEILLSNDQEIVLLNEQRVKSQTHLEAASYNKMIEEKNEQIKEYKSQIKCLKSDQERLKKNREEEVEKLNEVIEKLQEELSRIEQKVSVDFTSGADVAEYNKDQFADMADGKGILQSLAGDSHVTLANREEKILGASEIMNNIEMELENTSSSKGQNKVSRPSSQVFEPLQEDVRIAMQDMESELRQLQQVIKEKDSSLKQYYDQVITLKEQTQVIETLNETIERLQLELADNDHTIGEIDGSKHQSNSLYREKLILPTIEINDTDVTLLKCELEATNAELEQLKKEVENIRSSSEKIVINEVPAIKSEDRMDECHTVSIEKLSEALREKTAQHLATEALLVSVQEASQSTIHGLETQLHDIQKGAQEKDSQLQQLANTSQLRENQEMERLNDVIRSLQQNLAEVEQRTLVDSNVKEKDGENEANHRETLMQNNKLLLDEADLGDGESIRAKAELEETKMELTLLKEQLEILRMSQKHIDATEQNASGDSETAKAGLKATDLEQTLTSELLVSQVMFRSLEDTTQAAMRNLESQLQELQKVIQVKDSELLQYVNQQNQVNQQVKEIEQLNGVIEALQEKLGEAVQRNSVDKSESITQQIIAKDSEMLTQQMNGDTVVLPNTMEAKPEVKPFKEQSGQLQRTQENILGQDTGQSRRVTFVTQSTVLDNGVEEVSRQKTANQALLTSVQETKQSTIDGMESQLQELHKVIKERDLEIVLYLEEIETLKDQLKVESDRHGEMMLAMEDTLREKVAAALVSEAQLKAIQVHTKQMHEDDESSVQVKESKMLEAFVSKPSEEEKTESNISILSLRLLELEKQLSDLHEQLEVERDQVNIANQQVAEKERQLCELQQVLGSTMEKQDMDGAQSLAENLDSAISQGSNEVSDNPVNDLEHKIQIIQAERNAAREELSRYRETTEKLKQELMVKDSSLAHLEEDLREVKKCFAHAEEKLAFYMKRELQQEEQQNKSGIDFTDGVRSPDWTTLDTATSSSQTDKISSVNSSNQTSRVNHKHIGVQNELRAAPLSNSSDEVADLMERYTDKIGQMQELHAAEILDMEARHISEVDSLRRDQYASVQALTDECDSLKAVIQALKTSAGGAVPDSALSTSYHFTDAASSECDWSQGTYDVQSFDQIPGLRGDDDQFIPSQIKDLLRVVHQEGMQVLSLTEADGPSEETSFTVNRQPWCQERKALLETIASLKALISKIHIHKESEAHTRSDFHDPTPDWRGELIRAIQDVFCREQDVLMSAFHSQLAALGNCNATALLHQMQHRLQEQGMEQINAMDCIQNADRRSLLLEIQDLRAQLTNFPNDTEINPLFHANTEAGGVQHNPQDQPAHSEEIHLQLNSITTKANELQEQLESERLFSAEIKNQLALTKMELESALKLQHKHFKELESVRVEVKKRRDELDSANDTLANEQKKSRELQWTLEKEKTKRERNEQREKEELEDLQILLEDQKSKNLETSKSLEEEKQSVKNLQEQIGSRDNLYDVELSQERSKVSELQAFLDAEKTRSSELANALECKQGLEANVQSTDGNGQSEGHRLTEDLLRELQSQLDSKHHRVVELVSDLESYKLECVQLRQSLEEQRQVLGKELEAEQDATKLAGKQVEELMATVKELQQQLQEREMEVRRFQTEEKQLKETIQKLQDNAHKSVKENGSERRDLVEISTASKISADPARNEVQLLTGHVPNVLCPDPLSALDGDHGTDEASFSIDLIRRRLQQVSSKLRQLAAKASQRVLFEGADDNDFAWSQNNIQEVLSQLEHVAVLSLQGQNLVLPPGISANTLTEKLLTQNAELTGYVSRLTGEKNDLQNALLRLEGEVSRQRATAPSADYDNTVNTEAFAAEREAWHREKLNLHKSLKQTEAELCKVKAELRNETMQRDLGRDTENVALKRVYGKYLRSESFRKALVYQKKYLLLLLGGFQECEEATLALIARMGGQPTYTDLDVVTKHSRAFTRFRSAARVAVAISRMKFLVRRWQRATSPSTGGVNRNGFGQSIGNEVRTDSPYHPAGSVELYGEQRHSSCRSRSGFDSPQSTVNSQHRYMSSESSPCSHLQHYDPDRALTDYIARLEALQKRLGSVSSGSSANNTTHFGIRR